MERICRPAWATTLALLLILIGGFVRPASASIVYVNKKAPGATHDGTTWATPFTSVQSAINAATSGDEVWVAAGTYTESITLKSGVPLYGGFVGSETARGQRNWKSATTLLEPPLNTDTAVTATGELIVLDGFTLANCWRVVDLPQGSATVANCTITTCRIGIFAHGGAAAISNCNITADACCVYAESGSASIASCTIRSASTGITAYAQTSITGCDIQGTERGVYVARDSRISKSTVSGGQTGIDAAFGSLDISDCVIASNRVGIYHYNCRISLYNCTLTGNYFCAVATNSIWVLPVTNCIVAYNGRSFSPDSPRTPIVMAHNDFFENGHEYLAINLDSNIEADPRFVDRANGDLHLQPGSPCIDAGDDSVVAPTSGTDMDGRLRISGAHVDMGAYETQLPWWVSLGSAISGGVTVAEKGAYISADDGKLYARSTQDGSAVAGFPVDISAAVGATVKLPSRPAVYYGKTGKAIYLTTDRGDVVRVLPNGTVAWHVRPFPGQTVSTPAVTPDGYVYVNLSTGSGPFNNYVFKLDEATGTPLTLSPFLGYTNATDMGDFSPAANSRYLYVNSGWGSGSGLTLLNQDNLTVRSSFAGGQQCLSPLLLGSDLLLATRAGKAYKVNAVTMNPDLGFGHFGVADVGSQITAAPFADAAGNVYLGTADGRILKWTPGSGWFQPVYTTTGRIAGLTIDRSAGVLGFGTSNGAFTQVPLNNPAAATTVTPGGPISNGTVYESLTDRFIVVTDNGVLSGYPAIR